MVMRGVEKSDGKTVTSSMMGVFRDDPKSREEFLKLISRWHIYSEYSELYYIIY